MKIFRPEARSKIGIRIDAFMNSSVYPSPVHMHSGIELVYVYSGAGTTEIDGVAFPITKGTLCIIPEHMTHNYSTENPFLFYNILFGFDVFSRTEQNEIRALPRMRPLFFDTTRTGIRLLSLIPDYHASFEDVADKLVNECKNPDVFTPSGCKALLKELLIIIARAAHTKRMIFSKRPTGSFISMLGYIHEHFTEKISLAAVASSGGLSEKYAGVVFKKSAGVSLVDYLNTLRIEHAIRLLTRSDLSVSDIAFRSGFDNASYFSHMFRRYAHTTPLKFRKSAIKKS